MKVLVVDDSKTMRLLVIRTMRQAGFQDLEFFEAQNGQEGLDMYAKQTPDIVLSDWNMPVLNGLEFLKKLKEINDDVTFGFITSEISDEMQKLAAKNGSLFLIGKPFTPEAFLKKLAPYFKRR